MTGSAINSDSRSILPGSPISESSPGFVRNADPSSVCMGIATDGAAPRGVVTYTTDGSMTRTDWSLITGASSLAPGKKYYVFGRGKLATSGTQQVGVASSALALSVQIQPLTPKQSQIYPVDQPPTASLGTEGDFAYHSAKRALYGPKGPTGWTTVGYLQS